MTPRNGTNEGNESARLVGNLLSKRIENGGAYSHDVSSFIVCWLHTVLLIRQLVATCICVFLSITRS